MSIFSDKIIQRGRGGILGGDPILGRAGKTILPERWSPTDAAAWYAADFEKTIYQNSAGTTLATLGGDPVRRWETIPSSSADATNTLSDGACELQDSPAIRIAESIGTRAYLRVGDRSLASGAPGFAVFAVVTPKFKPSNDCILFHSTDADDGTTNRKLLWRVGAEWQWGGRRLDSDPYQQVTGGSVVIDQRTAIAGIMDYGEILDLQINGVSAGTVTPFQSAGLSDPDIAIGCGIGAYDGRNDTAFFRQFEGDVHELIIYRKAPTQQEIDQFFKHAHTFWGVELEA